MDELLKKDPVSQAWERKEATIHHWSVMKQLFDEVDKGETTEERLAIVQQMISEAQVLYAKLRASGVSFEYRSGPAHLKVWQDAINLFNQGL